MRICGRIIKKTSLSSELKHFSMLVDFLDHQRANFDMRCVNNIFLWLFTSLKINFTKKN